MAPDGGSSDWDPAITVAARPLVAWRGDAWRFHTRRYPGSNADGSLKTTGRYNPGRDRFPADRVWPALYTALAPHIALGERVRHTTPRALARLAEQRISRLWLSLRAVCDACDTDGCVEPSLPGISHADICHPADYRLTHELAAAVRARGADALLIPSCTRFRGGNLIVFPDRLQPESIVRVIDTEDPELLVDWEALV